MTKQSLRPILMTPGPVSLHPKVQESLAWPMIHHRTKSFEDILVETLSLLRCVFQTEQPCFILTSTGSGGMEALLANTMTTGDRVLVINSGKYGERWLKIAERMGRASVYNLQVPWGNPIDLNQLEDLLNKEKPTMVLTQACETSTGVLHPVQAISQLVKKENPETLLLVDGITAVGAMNIPMDAWNIDGLVGGSQKGFMLPTGLSFVCLSEKAWYKVKKINKFSYYLDLQAELHANQKGQTYFSSPVTLIRALNISLKIILEWGLFRHFERIEAIAHHTRSCLQTIGIKSFTQAPSPTLSTFRLPAADRFRQHLEDQYQLVIMSGQDHLKDQIIRIGHMGYLTNHDITESLKRIKSALKDFGHSVIQEHLFEQQVNFHQYPELPHV